MFIQERVKVGMPSIRISGTSAYIGWLAGLDLGIYVLEIVERF